MNGYGYLLNPLRAAIVDDILDWKWSSYHAMIGKEKNQPKCLETDCLLSQFHSHKVKAQKHYINFVRAGIGLESIWTQVNTVGFLAEEHYINEVKQKYESKGDVQLKEHSRLERRALAKALSWYSEQFNDKKDAMFKAYESGDYTMKKIAPYFNVRRLVGQ